MAEDGAQIRILLQHRRRDLPRLLGLPVGRLIGDDLDLRVLLEHLEGGLVHHHAVGRGELPGNDRDLSRLAAAGAAFLDDVLRNLSADAGPIGPDKGCGRLIGLEVDLQNLDAVGLRLLDLTRQQLDRGIVHDQHVGLLADRLGEQLRHRSRIEGRIADIYAVAVHRRVLSHAANPTFGERDAHRNGHEDHLLPGHVARRVGAGAGRAQCKRQARSPAIVLRSLLPSLYNITSSLCHSAFLQITDGVGLRVSGVEIVVDKNSRDQDDALEHVLGLRAEVVKRHAVAQHGDQRGANQEIADAPTSASERDAAEHDHQDHFEQQTPVGDDAEVDRSARRRDHEAGYAAR